MSDSEETGWRRKYRPSGQGGALEIDKARKDTKSISLGMAIETLPDVMVRCLEKRASAYRKSGVPAAVEFCRILTR